MSIPDKKRQTPEQKLIQSLNLYHSAMQLKIAALKQRYPELSEAEIIKMAKRIFFNAR
jgi:hypothetical protein